MLTKFVVTQKYRNLGYYIYETPINHVTCAIWRDMSNNKCSIVVIADNQNHLFLTRKSINFVKATIANSNQFPLDAQIHYLFVILNNKKEKSLLLNDVVHIDVNKGRMYHRGISEELKDEYEIVKSLLSLQVALDEKHQIRYSANVRFYHPWVVYLIIFTTFMIYAATIKDKTAYGVTPTEVINGRYVTMITYIFQHGNIMHLLGNMVTLVIAGTVLERYVGAAKFTCLYLVSGVYGAMFSVFLNPTSDIVTVGASGAICGIIGALIVKLLFTPQYLRLFQVSALTKTIGVTLLMGMLVSSINNLCHIGGLIAGILFSIVFQLSDMIEINKRYQKLNTICKKEDYV